MKKQLLLAVALLGGMVGNIMSAQQSLTLEECRQLALSGTTKAQVDQETLAAAEDMRKAALASMFPKIDANTAYMFNSGDFHLLSNQADFSFGSVIARDGIGDSHFTWSDDSYMHRLATDIKGNSALKGTELANIEEFSGQMIADLYQELYDRLSPDMRHTFVAQVGIVQPIYVGGRLRELYNLSKSAERIAGIQQDAHHDDIIVKVDEAYWRVVNVEQKKALAQDYYDLLVKLEGDVTEAVAAGLYTQSDLLSVKVKRSDAESKLMQATNGLILSKMALCQACGLPLTTDIQVDNSQLGEVVLHSNDIDVDAAVANRSELLLLDEAVKVAESNVKLAAAGLQPNIVASANYIYSNPNIEDGFSSDWRGKGFFTAGVVVNIPIAHADDILRVKAAKHTAKVAELQKEEAREMLVLQTTQANQKVIEANQKLLMADAAIKNAEENLKFAQEMFGAGMITTGDLMQAQTAWLKAHTDQIDAQVEVLVTETYFRKYTGTME